MAKKEPMTTRIKSYLENLLAPPTYERLMEEQLGRDGVGRWARSYAYCWGGMRSNP